MSTKNFKILKESRILSELPLLRIRNKSSHNLLMKYSIKSPITRNNSQVNNLIKIKPEGASKTHKLKTDLVYAPLKLRDLFMEISSSDYKAKSNKPRRNR